MEKLKDIVKINKALSDITRLRIMALLYKRKKLCVCEIKEVIGLSQPTVSSHLKILESSCLIKGFREGKWINYKMNEDIEEDKEKYMKFLFSLLKKNDQVAEDAEKAKKTDRFCLCRKTDKNSKN